MCDFLSNQGLVVMGEVNDEIVLEGELEIYLEENWVFLQVVDEVFVVDFNNFELIMVSIIILFLFLVKIFLDSVGFFCLVKYLVFGIGDEY